MKYAGQQPEGDYFLAISLWSAQCTTYYPKGLRQILFQGSLSDTLSLRIEQDTYILFLGSESDTIPRDWVRYFPWGVYHMISRECTPRRIPRDCTRYFNVMPAIYPLDRWCGPEKEDGGDAKHARAWPWLRMPCCCCRWLLLHPCLLCPAAPPTSPCPDCQCVHQDSQRAPVIYLNQSCLQTRHGGILE